MTRLRLLAALVPVLFVGFLRCQQGSSGGSIDTTFGTAGKVTIDFGSGDEASAVLVQSDGKIVVGGKTSNGSKTLFALARLDSTGALDTTFNGTGKVTTDFGLGDSGIVTLLALTGGRILAVGNVLDTGASRIALAVYQSDGTLDTSVLSGGTGTKILSIGSVSDTAGAAVVLSDGRIVVGGSTNNGVRNQYLLARLLANGSLDVSTITPVGDASAAATADIGSALVLLSNGGYALAGTSLKSGHTFGAVLRFDSSLVVDGTFGTAGVLLINVGLNTSASAFSDDTAKGLALLGDGRLTAAGSSTGLSASSSALVTSLSTGGQLDTTFNLTGLVTTSFGTGNSVLRAIVFGSGRLAAVGSFNGTTGSATRVIAVQRLSTFGSADPVVTTDVGGSMSEANAAAFQSNAKLVVVGRALNGSGFDMAVVRYN